MTLETIYKYWDLEAENQITQELETERDWFGAGWEAAQLSERTRREGNRSTLPTESDLEESP